MLKPDIALKIGAFQCFIVCARPAGLDDSDELDTTEQEAPKALTAKGRQLTQGQLPTAEEVVKYAKTGRVLEAKRGADGLIAAGIDVKSALGEKEFERISRLAEKFQSSEEMLGAKFESLSRFEHNTELNLTWGFHFAGDRFRIMYTVEHELDIIKSFAAYQEADLSLDYKSALQSAEAVGEQTVNETIWRCKSTSDSLPGLSSDSVTIYNFIDALDEDCKSIWFCSYTPPEESPLMFNGIEIPPCESGYARPTYFFSAALLTPLEEKSSKRVQRFRVTSVNEFRIPAVAAPAVKFMPYSVIARASRASMEESIVKFRDYVGSSTKLEERIATSPRAPLYDAIWAHLSGTGKPAK